MQTSASSQKPPSGPDFGKAFPEIFRIMDRWQCNQNEQCTLLGIDSRTTLNKYRRGKYPARFNRDMLERMSYILNINKSLKIIFTHKDSADNWVRKPSSHPFFNGSSAMDVMLHGNIADLYNVAARVNAWRGA